MILSFSHSGLRDVFFHGFANSIPSGLQGPCRYRLTILNSATCDADIRMSGLTVHASPRNPGVQEIPFMNRRIMFRWNGSDIDDVDFA